MGNTIYLIPNNAAVDAVMITKAEAIDGIRNKFGFSIDKVATIGDEIGDITMMRIPGLGNIGTVANAQHEVIDFVNSRVNGYVSDLSVFDGLKDFYDKCTGSGIELIVTDKDGVLKEGEDDHWGPQYAELAMNMGRGGNPYCVVLTGSAVSQNEGFRHQYGLDERLNSNPAIKKNPFLLIVENGAIHVNVLTGETENYCSQLNQNLLGVLKGPFETEVARRIKEEVLPEFGFEMSYDVEKQTGQVYHVKDKQAGVCFNVPRKDKAGQPFRKTDAAQKLRNREIEIMTEVADNLHLDYVVLK